MSRPPKAAIDRFLAKVTVSASRHAGTPCLEWTGALSDSGYGRFAAEVNGRRSTMAQAHRWLYQRWVGPIPNGLVLDHLCHDPRSCRDGDECPHRRCVNPLHVAVVTPGENQRRSAAVLKDACKYGHPFAPDNTYIHPTSGGRQCRTCRRADSLRRSRARRLAS